MPLEDTDIIGWGRYAKTKLANVPAGYLLWVRSNVKRNGATRHLLDYIEDNLDAINLEIKTKNKEND